MTWPRTTVACGLFVLSAMAQGASLTDEVFDRTATAVAQVSAEECDGEPRTGTGFLYEKRNLMVTSLHVVAGCRRLSAYFEHAGSRTLRARLDRVLEGADLALLRLHESAADPLEAAAAAPVPNDHLEAIAFFLSAPSLDNKTLKVTHGSTRLRDMLPPQQRQDVDRNSTLNMNLSIVRLDGHLLPGASGAPLLNSQGRVAAVGNGGLNHGAASISWAIPAKHLDELLESDERGTGAGFSHNLFAAVAGQSSGSRQHRRNPLRCGGIEFVVTGTRRFDELSRGTDDPMGLGQLVAALDLSSNTLQSFEYRIYTPLNDGAAIAVPAWMSVYNLGAHCEARSMDGRLVVAFGGSRVTHPAMAQIASVEFESVVLGRTGRYWWPDPMYTYVTPLRRFDGFTAARKAWNINDGQGMPAWGFETLMTKRNVFAGVFAVRHKHDPGRLQSCRLGFADASTCAGVEREVADFSQTILGVHLSTFPIY